MYYILPLIFSLVISACSTKEEKVIEVQQPTPTPAPCEPCKCPVPPNPTPPPPPTGDSELQVQVNAARRLRGLPEIASTAALDCAALRHARDIAKSKACGHVGSDGSQFWQRVQACGGKNASGEIVACGYPDAKSAVVGWTNSPGHAAIMYDPKQVAMGTARVDNFYVVVWAK